MPASPTRLRKARGRRRLARSGSLNEAAARGERLRAQGSARSSRLRAMTNIHSNPTPLRQKFIEYLTLNRKAERTVPRLSRQLMSPSPAKPIDRPPTPSRLSSAATVTPSFCPDQPLEAPGARGGLTPARPPPPAHPPTQAEVHPGRGFSCWGRLHPFLLLLL